ncbi:MAG: carbohydrate ABC transporter permease [Oscillospiraceae bacterium]|nr:carbohydrate ABC transporter permease [Oscillospiraceae bacterium]
MTIICVIYMYPIFMVLMNSLKVESAISTSTAFQLPNSETFAGFDNYVNAITARGFFASFGYTLFITVSSVAAILLFCSMFAWYITRVRSWVTKGLYLLCAFSMVVPFQMVMFTLSSLADSMRINFFDLYTLRFNTPWMLWFVYLGFGAGLAVFMFCGFMKSVPIEIEEASMIDGCNPIQTYFKVVFPLLKPTMVSVAILEAMWIWNDYLLPTLILDIDKYKTISMLIQYFRGSYGRVEMGPMMACIMLAILPIIIVYLAGQKYIIKGVVSGAVKG